MNPGADEAHGGGDTVGHLDRSMESSSMLLATDAWRRAFPGAVVGALVMQAVRNPELSATLEAEKRRLEGQLRAAAGESTHDGPGADRVVRAYVDYYRARGKTYRVKAQRESVARKGKPIPSRAALVEAMFMAELKNLILTAGHDLDAIAAPVRATVTAERDRYVLLNGTEVVLEHGDMMMVDSMGILSSVLRGADRRTASLQKRTTCSSPPTRPPVSARMPFEAIWRTFGRPSS